MTLVLIKIQSRAKHALQVQKELTKHGCTIAVRLGLHEVADDQCSNDGLIVLQVKPDKKAVDAMIRDLQKIKDVKVKKISM